MKKLIFIFAIIALFAGNLFGQNVAVGTGFAQRGGAIPGLTFDGEGIVIGAPADSLIIEIPTSIEAELTLELMVTTGITSTGRITATLTTEQLRLAYDATNYATWTVAADGALTIATVDASAAEGDINLNPDGNVGIKTAAPSVALEVTGAILASTSITATTALSGATLAIDNDAGAVNLAEFINDKDGALGDSSGFVDQRGNAVFGIDASIYTAASVAAAFGRNVTWDGSQTIYIRGGSDEAAAMTIGSTGNISFDFAAAGTGVASMIKKMIILNTGNVGMGSGYDSPGTLLQLKDANSYITLQNSTAENGEGEAETRIIFEDHADIALAQIEGSHSGAADDTKGKLILSTHTGSALTTALTIDDVQAATFAATMIYVPNAASNSGTSVADDAAITVTNYIMRMVGADAEAVLDTDPAVNDGTADGQIVIIQGTADGNLVTIADNVNTQLAGGNSMTLGDGDVLCLMWDSNFSMWIEQYRSDN